MNTTENIILGNAEVAKALGTDCALFLHKIKYWSEKCGKSLVGEPGVWIYNSYAEWHKQFPFWSLSKLRRIVKFLEGQNLLFSKKVNAKKWNHTKWYSLNTKKIKELSFSDESQGKKRTNRCTHFKRINIQETNYTNKKSLSLISPLIKKTESKHLKEKKEKTKGLNKISKEEKKTIKQSTSKVQDITTVMTSIWNKVFEASQSKIKAHSNKYIEHKLLTLYQNKFNKNLDLWQSYAEKVMSSKFLKGESGTFKATFTWLLKESVVDAVLDSKYEAKKKPSKTIGDSNAEKMIEIWQDHTQFKSDRIELNKNRILKLNQILKTYFESSLCVWRKFVLNISKSKFLMGGVTNFKASIWWVIQEEILLKIQEGNYHSKSEWEGIASEQQNNKLIQELEEFGEEGSSSWKETLRDLLKRFGKNTYIAWFSKLQFDSIQDGVLKLIATSGFIRDYVDTHYNRRFLQIAEKHFDSLRKVCFVVTYPTSP